MELEEIKHKLNSFEYSFFSQLREQLDLPLYFIGSVTRGDFIKGKSDLDVEVFSDNIVSTKIKADYLLTKTYKKRKNMDRIIMFKVHNTPVSGYKYYFKDKENREVEYSLIYDGSDKIINKT
jgi:tRNA nucleotidyltransferase (CCA-adding enzyme)